MADAKEEQRDLRTLASLEPGTSGRVVRISSVYGPIALTPEIVCALPSMTASAPTISLR